MEDKSFIRERIEKKPMSKKQIAVRFLMAVALAIVFGTFAGISFAFVSSHIGQTNRQEEPPSGEVTIPRDTQEEPESETESECVQSPVEETETDTTEDSKEALEDIIQSMIDAAQPDIEDAISLAESVNSVALTINHSIVTVSAINQETDWFNNPVETQGNSSGIIWNITENEIMILTSHDTAKNNEILQVTFSEGTSVNAVIRGTDSLSGLSVITVNPADLSEPLLDRISAVAMGNSYTVSNGTPIIIAGSPVGYTGSTVSGRISYVQDSVSSPDMEERIMYLNVSTAENGDGFVLNLRGELIGVVKPSMTGTITTALGISNLKGIIELLCNGQQPAYLGVTGQELPDHLALEYGIEKGVFVTEAILEGPAYSGGIQNGDVICRIGAEKITTVRGMQSVLERMIPGTVTEVEVYRSGSEGYTPVVFWITLGGR